MGNECRTTLVPLKFPTLLYGKMVVWRTGNGSVVPLQLYINLDTM